MSFYITVCFILVIFKIIRSLRVMASSVTANNNLQTQKTRGFEDNRTGVHKKFEITVLGSEWEIKSLPTFEILNCKQLLCPQPSISSPSWPFLLPCFLDKLIIPEFAPVALMETQIVACLRIIFSFLQLHLLSAINPLTKYLSLFSAAVCNYFMSFIQPKHFYISTNDY